MSGYGPVFNPMLARLVP